jgi:precorrin-3B methylase
MAGATKGQPSALDAALAAAANGDLPGARGLLDAAVAADPSPARLLERAAFLSDQGYVVEAIADVDRVVRARPDDAAAVLRRAQLHVQRRNYVEAEKDLDAAVRLTPRESAPRLRRAEFYALVNRLEEAERELESAAREFPDDEPLRLALLGTLVQRGRRAPAGRLIASLRRGGSPRAGLEAAFAAACLDFRFRRRGLGARGFKTVMAALPENDPLSLRARFYWAASRVLDPGFRRRIGMKKTKQPELVLCGLGIFAPYNASLDVLMAMSRSDVLFNNVAGPEMRALVSEFCDDVRPAAYQAFHDEPQWADKIFAELDKGRKVAFVTRGHPLVFGGLARELIKRCRERGIPFRCLSSVSSIDHFIAYAGQGLGDDFGGISAIDLPEFQRAEVHSTRIPLTLCFYGGVEDRAGVRRAREALERFYPGALACWMFGPKYDAPPAVVRIDELDRRYDRLHPSLMLYVPPLARP